LYPVAPGAGVQFSVTCALAAVATRLVGGLSTEIATAAEVVVLPAASRAMAVRV
jgi:hypothetical protein